MFCRISISLVLLWLASGICSAQPPVALTPAQTHQVEFASLSPDAGWLVLAQSNDTIAVLSSGELRIQRKIPFAKSANGMRLWHTIGKAAFAFTSAGDLLYLEKQVSADSLVMYLCSRSLSSDSLRFRQRVVGLAGKDLVWPTDLRKASFYYSLQASEQRVALCIDDKIMVYDSENGQLISSLDRPNPQSAALNTLGDRLALIATDTLEVRTLPDQQLVLKRPVADVTSVRFLSDSLLSLAGKEVHLLKLPDETLSEPVLHSFGEAYGISVSPEGAFAVSGAQLAFPSKGFAAVYTTDLSLSAVFHLAENTGFTPFFHPERQELWAVTAEGLLYRFELNPPFSPRPVPQRGHRQSLNSVSLSKDKRWLLSSSRDREVILWDVPTGRVLERYATNESLLYNAIFAENQRDILYKVFDSYRKVHRSIPSNWMDALTDNVYLDSASAAYARSQDEDKARLLERGKALAHQYGFDENNSIALSDKYTAGIVRQGYKDAIRVVRLSSGELRNLEQPDGLISFWEGAPLEFYSDHILILPGINNTIVFMDVETGQVVKRLGGKEEYYGEMLSGVSKAIFNSTGDTLFTVTNQRVIDGWDLRRGERFFHYALKMRGVNQEDALNYENGTISIFLQNEQTNMLGFFRLNGEKPKVLAYGDTTFVVEVPEGIFAAHKAPGMHRRVSLSPDASQAMVLRVNYLSDERREVFVDRWDLRSMKVTASFPVPGPSLPCWKVSWEHEMVAVWDYNATSKKEQEQLAAALGKDVTLGGMNTHPFVSVLSLNSGKIQELSLDRLEIFRLGPEDVRFKNDSELYLRDDYHSRLYIVQLRNKKATPVLPAAPYGSATIGPHFWFDGKGALIFTPTPGSFDFNYQLRSVAVGNGQVIAESGTSGSHITTMSNTTPAGTFALGLLDNSISIRDSKTLHEKYRIFQNEDFRYLLLTPDHYYKADRQAAASLFFNWNFQTFSLNQFDLLFNRPDKVLAATGFSSDEELSLMEKAFLKRTRSVQSLEMQDLLLGNLPEITILDREAVPFSSTNSTLSFRVSATAKSAELASLQVLANGVPVFGKSGQPLSGRAVETEVLLKLVPGKNVIRVYCLDKAGLRSLEDELVVEHTGMAELPELYFFASAIDEYRLPALNLKYAVKDARDLATLFSQAEGFSAVHIDTLFNEAVSSANLQRLKEKMLKSKPGDVVITFFAGHGFLDENFDFRYALWDVDPEQPASGGLLYSELEELLDGIPARNKLMLVDACHSGMVDKDEILQTTEELVRQRSGGERTVTQSFTSVHHKVFRAGLIDRKGFELMQELFYGLGSSSGAQVVVATAGDRTALESEEWQNGVFTYSIITALKEGKSDADMDGTISTEELVKYLQPTVKELTNGKQVPRFREENIDNHFILWQR